MRRRTVPSFVSVIQSAVTPFDRSKTLRRTMRTASKSATFLATGKCELSAIQEGRKRCKFLARKVQNSSPILRCTFLARKNAKLIANFSCYLGDVTSVSLSLYLSLSSSAPHAQYRKRFRASIMRVRSKESVDFLKSKRCLEDLSRTTILHAPDHANI